MYTVRLSDLEMPEAGYENDPTVRAKANFPFSAATGTKSTAVVYFEVEPGHRLGAAEHEADLDPGGDEARHEAHLQLAERDQDDPDQHGQGG